jgi:H+/Cl- antiporter ClcA
MANQKQRTGAQKQLFSVSSPGFLYSAIVAALSLLTLAGVSFGDTPQELANEATNAVGSGGFFALLGVLGASIGFPIWNAYQKKNLSFKGIWRNSLTWVALGVLFFDVLALLGLHFPDGTVQAIVSAVDSKDWVSLISMFVTVIIPTVIRFIKEKNAAPTAA